MVLQVVITSKPLHYLNAEVVNFLPAVSSWGNKLAIIVRTKTYSYLGIAHYNEHAEKIPPFYTRFFHIRNISTLRTGHIILCVWLLNVADRAHIMILGHVMLQRTIPCSGDMQTHNL
jgi:hypothetical protein